MKKSIISTLLFHFILNTPGAIASESKPLKTPNNVAKEKPVQVKTSPQLSTNMSRYVSIDPFRRYCAQGWKLTQEDFEEFQQDIATMQQGFCECLAFQNCIGQNSDGTIQPGGPVDRLQQIIGAPPSQDSFSNSPPYSASYLPLCKPFTGGTLAPQFQNPPPPFPKPSDVCPDLKKAMDAYNEAMGA
jgi:hypothetical protein